MQFRSTIGFTSCGQYTGSARATNRTLSHRTCCPICAIAAARRVPEADGERNAGETSIEEERATGIEPVRSAWEADMPPQHLARVRQGEYTSFAYVNTGSARLK